MKKTTVLTIVLAPVAVYFLSIAILDYYRRNIAPEKLASRIKTAEADVQKITDSVKDYVKDTGTLPTKEQGIEALINKPTTAPTPINWQGPYLQKENWIDPWGQFYQYKRYLYGINKHSFMFQVFSYGPQKNDKFDDIVLMNTHTAGRFNKSSEPEGFRDIPWGTPRGEMKGKDLQSAACPHSYDKNSNCYISENDDFIFEGIPVEKILYEFLNNKFYGVKISIEEPAHLIRMKRNLINKFGLPEGHEEFGGEKHFSLRWHGQITNMRFDNFAPEQLQIASSKIGKEWEQQVGKKEKTRADFLNQQLNFLESETDLVSINNELKKVFSEYIDVVSIKIIDSQEFELEGKTLSARNLFQFISRLESTSYFCRLETDKAQAIKEDGQDWAYFKVRGFIKLP